MEPVQVDRQLLQAAREGSGERQEATGEGLVKGLGADKLPAGGRGEQVVAQIRAIGRQMAGKPATGAMLDQLAGLQWEVRQLKGEAGDAKGDRDWVSKLADKIVKANGAKGTELDNMLGAQALAEGKHEDARAAFERVLAANPEDAIAQAGLHASAVGLAAKEGIANDLEGLRVKVLEQQARVRGGAAQDGKFLKLAQGRYEAELARVQGELGIKAKIKAVEALRDGGIASDEELSSGTELEQLAGVRHEVRAGEVMSDGTVRPAEYVRQGGLRAQLAVRQAELIRLRPGEAGYAVIGQRWRQ